MNLLMLSLGRRMSLLRHLRQAANKLQIPLRVVATEIYPYTPALFYSHAYYIVKPTLDSGYREQILDIIKKERIDAILPGNDLDLDFLSTAPLPNHVKILFSGPEMTLTFRRKSSTCRFFSDIGLLFPKHYPIRTGLEYPVILKEDRGFGSRNQFILSNSIDLEANFFRLQEPFLQKYIPGQEYTVDIFSDDNHQTINMVPRVRERVRAGVSDVGKIAWHTELLAILQEKAPLFRLSGPWNIQCIHHQGRFYFLEVNPRFSGGIPLTIEAGADFCTNLLEWALDRPLTRYKKIHRNLVMMKYESEHFIYE